MVDFHTIINGKVYTWYGKRAYPMIFYMSDAGNIAWIIDSEGKSSETWNEGTNGDVTHKLKSDFHYEKYDPDNPEKILGYRGPDNKRFHPKFGHITTHYPLYPQPMSEKNIKKWSHDQAKKSTKSKAKEQIRNDIEILTYLQNLPSRKAAQYTVIYFYHEKDKGKEPQHNAIFLSNSDIKNGNVELCLTRWTLKKTISQLPRPKYTLNTINPNQWTQITAVKTSGKLLKTPYKISTTNEKKFKEALSKAQNRFGPYEKLKARRSPLKGNMNDLTEGIKKANKRAGILSKILPHKDDIKAHLKDLGRPTQNFHNNHPISSKATWEVIDNKRNRAREARTFMTYHTKFFRPHAIEYNATLRSQDGYRALHTLFKKNPPKLFKNKN